MVQGAAPRVIRRLSPLKLVLISAAIGIVCLIAYIIGVALSGNVHTVITGEIYRAGQPRPGLLDRMERQHGIRTVLNLRATTPAHPGMTTRSPKVVAWASSTSTSACRPRKS